MKISHIRNFCIIAHIDHGKSTLADRLLQVTGTISERDMQEQVLDSMDLERERGVTIKASAVRMEYTARSGEQYEFNLIDTPGHVDFSYEVSRALQACEGALLVVDASQGIEAQTLANLYLAIEQDLEIIPVINKIDLPAAMPGDVTQEIVDLLGIDPDQVLHVSAKTGIGVESVLEAIVARIPPPKGKPDAPLRALIFDSHYDLYKGVIAYVRVIDGEIDKNTEMRLMSNDIAVEPVEIGRFSPEMKPVKRLTTAQVGYVATGLKTVRECQVGDTLTLANQGASEPLPGYKQAKPMVFASFYPVEGENYEDLRDALEKLQLNDASLTFQPETSQALNFGFRCGFLGLFHMEIVQERLEREYDMDIIATAPSVEYRVTLHTGESIIVDRPSDLPDPGEIEVIHQPWMRLQIFMPENYIGVVMDLVKYKHGEYIDTQYIDSSRISVDCRMPLAEMIVDFYDRLKSITRGYASLDYHFDGYRPGNMVKLDVLVNREPVDALAMIVHEDDAYQKGQRLVSKLKKLIPRQLFEVPIQAAVGSKIISRANVHALRKDVLAKCYGGDVTRKRKLLEQQKKGKKRMKRIGRVEVPQEAFLALLQLDEE